METGLLRFGDFRIDLQRRLLWRRDELLEPERREFELLRLLIEAHPETLTRRQLIDELWKNQEISDASLAQLIRRTRKLLDDDAHAPRYLKTLHGIGLRLIPEPVAKRASPSRPPRRRIGLLPVINASNLPHNDWVEKGLAEILLQQLEHRLGLSVQFILHESDSREQTMRQYGCQSLIQVRLEPGRQPRRLICHIEPPGQSQNYQLQAEASSILGAAEMLLEQIQHFFDEPASQAGAGRSQISSHSGNPAANELYARGLQALHQGEYLQAEQLMRSALDTDSGFTWASVKLAEALVRQNRLQEAEALIQPLLDRPSSEPAATLQARMTRCNICFSRGELETAAIQGRELIRSSHQLGDEIGEVRAWISFGTAERACDRLDSAIDALQNALELSRNCKYPLGEGMALYNLGNVYLFLDDGQSLAYYEQAEALFALTGQEHHQAMAKLQIGTLLRDHQRLEAAEQHFIDARSCFERCGDPVNAARSEIELINLHTLRRDYRCSIEGFAALLPRLESDQLDYPIWLSRQLMARAWLNLHRPDLARKLMLDDGRHAMSDPSYHLLQAHCLYEERDLEAALHLAERIQAQHGRTWQQRHQDLLDGYRRAHQQKQWFPLPI